MVAAEFASVLLLQTEDERQLRKMVRRDEKKMSRKKDGDRDVVDHGKVGFNPQELRNQRFVVQIKCNALLL